MTDNSTPREGLLAIGTTLANGKYRIEKYLASGGFGNTYMAIDTAFDERVAIKELFIKGVCGRMDNATDISISLTENQRTFNAKSSARRHAACANSKTSTLYGCTTCSTRTAPPIM